MAPQLPPPASPPSGAGRRLLQRNYSVGISDSKQDDLSRDPATSAPSGGGRLRRRLQVDESLGNCTTITITYSAESSLDSIAEEVNTISAQATSDGNSTRALLGDETTMDNDASSGCGVSIQTSFTLISTTYINHDSIQLLDADFIIGTIHPSPPPPPPEPPPSAPPPNVPPVTLEAVNELLSGLLSGGEVTEEGAGAAVDALSSMLDATSGGTAGSDVAGALVAGIEMLGGALLSNKEVGAPPTVIVSADLQVAVEKVAPADMGKTPFVVPSAGGGSSSAGVVAPNDLDLPDVDGIGKP